MPPSVSQKLSGCNLGRIYILGKDNIPPSVSQKLSGCNSHRVGNYRNYCPPPSVSQKLSGCNAVSGLDLIIANGPPSVSQKLSGCNEKGFKAESEKFDAAFCFSKTQRMQQWGERPDELIKSRLLFLKNSADATFYISHTCEYNTPPSVSQKLSGCNVSPMNANSPAKSRLLFLKNSADATNLTFPKLQRAPPAFCFSKTQRMQQ